MSNATTAVTTKKEKKNEYVYANTAIRFQKQRQHNLPTMQTKSGFMTNVQHKYFSAVSLQKFIQRKINKPHAHTHTHASDVSDWTSKRIKKKRQKLSREERNKNISGREPRSFVLVAYIYTIKMWVRNTYVPFRTHRELMRIVHSEWKWTHHLEQFLLLIGRQLLIVSYPPNNTWLIWKQYHKQSIHSHRTNLIIPQVKYIRFSFDSIIIFKRQQTRFAYAPRPLIFRTDTKLAVFQWIMHNKETDLCVHTVTKAHTRAHNTQGTCTIREQSL